MRWWNVLLGVAPIIAIYLIYIKNSVNSVKLFEFIILCLTIQLIMSVGFIFNDIVDKEIDEVNRPNHYSIGKTISVIEAKKLIFIFSIIIAFLTYYISNYVFKEWAIIGLSVYSILIIYSLFLKQTPLIGNIIIAGLASFLPIVMLFFLPNDAFIENPNLNDLIITYSCFSFSIMLPREISLDIEDEEGDRLANCKTLPILIGRTKAKLFVILLIFISILISVILTIKFTQILIPYLVINIYLIYYIKIFWKANSKTEYITARNHLRNVLMMGLLGFALASV